MSQSIGMISLGCAKNQVNAEQMLFLLRVAGYEILPDPDGADLVIINTPAASLRTRRQRQSTTSWRWAK